MSQLYHLGIEADDVPACVVLLGPGLASDRCAAAAGAATELAARREYRSWRVPTAGTDILIAATGVGGPPLAIAVEELSRAGARAMVLVDRPVDGPEEPLLVTGAIRDEGTTRHYAPSDYPAVPDPELVGRLHTALDRHVVGIVRTLDVASPGVTAPAPAVGIDLHAATLFVVAAARGVRAAAVAVSNQEDGEAAVVHAVEALTTPPSGATGGHW